ncbi:MAG: DUF4358 domain-containing protein [Ruminococcus sp.]|nr:DUF4358 domain-containing protein [Ruminococcus sp.]
MKKIVSILCAAIICLVAFAGCSGQTDVDLKSVLDEMNSAYDTAGLEKITDVNDLNTYYQINPDDVKQFAAEISSSADSPVEVVLVEAKDATAAQNVTTQLSNRYNSIYSQYASYSPDQLDMVKACKVTTDGNFVSMIVSKDAAGMLDIFYKYVK